MVPERDVQFLHANATRGVMRHYREKSGTLLIDPKPVRDDEESTGWTERQPPPRIADGELRVISNPACFQYSQQECCIVPEPSSGVLVMIGSTGWGLGILLRRELRRLRKTAL